MSKNHTKCKNCKAATRLLNTNQAAKKLNISIRTPHRRIAEGHFITLKIGRVIRILESSIDSYIERQIYLYELENGIPVSDDDK